MVIFSDSINVLMAMININQSNGLANTIQELYIEVGNSKFV